MKIFKFVLKNYLQALVVLLIIYGSILWFRPEKAIEFLEIIIPLSLLMRIWLLLSLNFLWSITFIVFDLWNSYRVYGIEVSGNE